MSINRVKETLLLNIFDLSLKEKEIIAYVHAMDFEDVSILKAYSYSMKRKMPVLANVLFNEKSVRTKFKFMDDSIPYFVENDKIFSLQLLFPPLIDKTYEEILQEIFGDDKFKLYRKRVGVALKKFGTNLLNNIYILSLLVDIHVLIDKILELDHNQAIDEQVLTKLKLPEFNLEWLLSNYKISRVFKVLLTYEDEYYTDSLRIINMIKNIEGEGYKEVVMKYIGKKPISFHDIHARLLPKSCEVENNHLSSMSLRQDIEELDGDLLYEYTISIPKTGKDLLMTGAVLRHCVGSYIDAVVSKECLIINLSLENKLVFTVELVLRNKRYHISQFRGYRNSSKYEGEDGAKYRAKIIEKVNNLLGLNK